MALAVCTGAGLALVMERSGDDAAALAEVRTVEARIADELRPSLADFPEPANARRSAMFLSSSSPTATPGSAAAIHDRFAFVSPEVGTLAMPWEPAEIIASPAPSWSTEVRALATATARNIVSLPASVARAVKRTYSLKGRLAEIAPVVIERVRSKFRDAKVQWPPVELA